MSEKKYNILWIDDKHEELMGFKMQAFEKNIILTCFKSLEKAKIELESKLPFYDGILLDAKFFENEDDVAGSEDIAALDKAKAVLLQLPKKFTLFVLTGQAQLFEDKTFNAFFPKYFRKGIAEDIQNLFQEIKLAADQQPDTQIRHKYNSVFELCTNKYIGQESAKILLEVLKSVENEIINYNSEDLFNSIRKIIEKLFASFNKLGLLPDDVFKGAGWINQSSIFLSGNNHSYKMNGEILPPIVAFLLKNTLSVIQDASHSEGDLKLKINNYILQSHSSYLFKSIVFQLLDILIWFKRFSNENHDLVKNKLLWERIITSNVEVDWLRGEVIRIADNGYGTFKPENENGLLSIIPKDVNNHELKKGQIIEVTTRIDGTGKKLIQNIRKIL